MAISIVNFPNSFVRFSEDPGPDNVCGWDDLQFNLPVYAQDDVSFQVVVQASTEAEADELCQPDASEVEVSLVDDCNTAPGLIDFAEKPTRFRLSPTQLLYNWQNGFPGWPGPIVENQCFQVRLLLNGLPFCSNNFERILDPCFTSVLEFGNEEDAFGFKYCYGGAIPGGSTEDTDCEPTIIQFINQSTLVIPYTALLESKYGQVPTIQTWIYDSNNELTNMGIQAKFDAFPPTQLLFDFGGPATGIIVIR